MSRIEIRGHMYPPDPGFNEYLRPSISIYPTASSHGTPAAVVTIEGRGGLVVVSGAIAEALEVAVAAYREGERTQRAARQLIRRSSN